MASGRPDVPLTPPAAVVAGRGSCGCTPDPLAPGDEPLRPVDTAPEVLREELTTMLRETLTHGRRDRPVDPAAISDALAAVEHLTTRGGSTTSELRGLLSTISGLGHRPDLLHHVANTISEHVQRTVGRADGTMADLTTALWHLQASAYLSRSEGLERLLTEQYRIGFKLVNDSLGHLVGDQLLTTVAERLRSELRSVDMAARFGGDEFAVLLSDPAPDEVLVIARRIQERIAEPVLLAGHEVTVTASAGIATS